MAQVIQGAQTAHAMILDRWRSHVGTTGWTYFGNIGTWGNAYLDRATETEYMQWDNSAATALYYNAFTDKADQPLDASSRPAYRVTFAANQIPDASRFWSLTAYLPNMTLVPNQANKYVVASYTPGLQKNADGSLTLYIQPNPPTTAPSANWLPVPSNGEFSIVLRVYGPQGNTGAGNTCHRRSLQRHHNEVDEISRVGRILRPCVAVIFAYGVETALTPE